MSPDLRQAKVFYVVRENVDRDQVQIALDKALGFIKAEVARENLFRLMPEFFFLPDPGLDRAAKLEKLFQAAKIGAGIGRGFRYVILPGRQVRFSPPFLKGDLGGLQNLN